MVPALHSRAESNALFSRTADEMMKRVAIHSVAPIVLALLEAGPLAAQIAPNEGASPPDKSNYTMLNPTPDAELRDFRADRPPKANLPCPVDVGRFQYESDVFNGPDPHPAARRQTPFCPEGGDVQAAIIPYVKAPTGSPGNQRQSGRRRRDRRDFIRAAARFDAAKHGQDFGRAYLGDWTRPDGRPGEAQQPFDFAQGLIGFALAR